MDPPAPRETTQTAMQTPSKVIQAVNNQLKADTETRNYKQDKKGCVQSRLTQTISLFVQFQS